MRSAGWVWGAVITLGVGFGCGQADSSRTCGPGTKEVGGQCVPETGAGGAAGSGGQAGATTGGAAGESVGGSSNGGMSGEGGSAGTSVGGSASASGNPTGGCPTTLPGPKMVEVSTVDGTRYCIDATEVTGAQYIAFSKAKGSDMSGQPAVCAGNSAYLEWEADTACPPPKVDHPAHCVDWCDAYMYCQWAGKRLCAQSEWYNACSEQGKYKYPYGDTYAPLACNGGDYDLADGSTPVGSLLDCSGADSPFDRVYDMSGNVAEWLGTCSGFNCLLVGGNFATLYPADVSCQPAPQGDISAKGKGTGFRCCADVP